jgi:hypothetical protein
LSSRKRREPNGRRGEDVNAAESGESAGSPFLVRSLNVGLDTQDPTTELRVVADLPAAEHAINGRPG